MSQHIGKLYRFAASSFLFFLLVDVCVGGTASKENAAVTDITAQPSLLTTPEPWHLLVTQTPAKEKAKEGETVVLNCHFNSPQHPSLTDPMVKWYKEDEKGQMDLLENNVTISTNNSRFFMSGDLSQGDASLVILNVTVSDHGIYFCEVTLPDRTVVTGDGTKLRIRRALGLFGIEESIGTIIGVVAAGVGGIVILIVILTPQLRRCVLCMRHGSHQVGGPYDLHLFSRHPKIFLVLLSEIPSLKEEMLSPFTVPLPPPDGQLVGDRDTARSSASLTAESLPAFTETRTNTPCLVLPTQHHPLANPLQERSHNFLTCQEALEEFIALY